MFAQSNVGHVVWLTQLALVVGCSTGFMPVFACAFLTAKPFTRLHVAPFGFGNVELGNKCARKTRNFFLQHMHRGAGRKYF
jgi:hypothetical protein